MTVTTVESLYEEISRLKAELDEAICIIDKQRKTFERILAEKAEAQKDADLLRQFTKWADQGYCPALVFDDNGHWAVSFEGAQTLTIGDEAQDVATSFHVSAGDWRDTVQEAIRAALAAIKQEQSE